MQGIDTTKHRQGHLLYPDLLETLNPKSPLLQLAKVIPWDSFEKEFAPLYSNMGRPAKPIRLMVGLLLLKQIENLSDERIVEAWVQNPYYQAFCGIALFQWEFPCDPSELVYFRKRIGEKGIEKIFQASVLLHKNACKEQEIIVDTTVQEKNITFPTDTKLRTKVIAKCWKIAKLENVELRRSYKRELKKQLRVIRFSKSRKDKKLVNASIRRVRTIANALLRNIERKLPAASLSRYKDELDLCKQAVNQKRDDAHKIYSLHEPKVACIAKGKVHKKYEFGSKAAIATTKTSNVIVGVKNFETNVHDSKTLEAVLSQVCQIGIDVKKAFCDRGFRGKTKVLSASIEIPGICTSKTSAYEKEKIKKNFRRRSAIEPIIGHIKSDFRLARNYLKGVVGDSINLLMAAAAFNYKKWMREYAQGILHTLFLFFSVICLQRLKGNTILCGK